MWSKLKEADHKILIDKKLMEIEATRKHEGNKQFKSFCTLSAVINVLWDLMKLAKCHSIENNLCYDDGLNHLQASGQQ